MDQRDAPFVELTHADGAFARVHLDGGQVSSWRPAGSGEDRLFVSRHAHYGAGASLRGGIPVCFPQFGAMGPLRQHGFARNARWAVVRQTQSDDGARAVLRLTDTDVTCAEWPHAFNAELAVHVAAASLTVALTVVNTGDRPFAFTAALHPYFSVRDAFTTRVSGLSGLSYRDALRDGAVFRETGAQLAITGHIDRVYIAAPDVLEIVEPHRTLRIEKHGFPDAVVWNPGADITAAKADFASGDERLMLCVEAGAIMQPVSLAPGAAWTGTQVMRA